MVLKIPKLLSHIICSIIVPLDPFQIHKPLWHIYITRARSSKHAYNGLLSDNDLLVPKQYKIVILKAWQEIVCKFTPTKNFPLYTFCIVPRVLLIQITHTHVNFFSMFCIIIFGSCSLHIRYASCCLHQKYVQVNTRNNLEGM